jgi:hypothetical protein
VSDEPYIDAPHGCIHRDLLEALREENAQLRAGKLGAELQLLHPEPGDVLILRGVDMPVDDDGRVNEEWREHISGLIERLGVPVLAFESETANATLERADAILDPGRLA